NVKDVYARAVGKCSQCAPRLCGDWVEGGGDEDQVLVSPCAARGGAKEQVVYGSIAAALEENVLAGEEDVGGAVDEACQGARRRREAEGNELRLAPVSGAGTKSLLVHTRIGANVDHVLSRPICEARQSGSGCERDLCVGRQRKEC